MTIKITKQHIKNSGTITTNSASNMIKQDLLIQFCTDPIAVIEHMTGDDMGSRSGRDYTSIFTDPEDWNWEYNRQLSQIELHHISPEDQKTAQLVREHWEDVLIIKRMRGEQFTNWEQDLSEYLAITRQNQCRVQHLKQFCKLSVFYSEYCAVTELLDSYPKPRKLTTTNIFDNSYQVNELKYIRDIAENASHKRNQLRFFFEDVKGELYVWCPQNSDYAKPMLEMLWQGYQKCKYRISPSYIYDREINLVYDLKPVKQ